MPAYSFADPIVLVFVVLPIGLVAWLLWRVMEASLRLDESDVDRARALRWTAIVAGAWMALTWGLADAGILRLWEATPPPFAVLPVGIVVLAITIAGGRYGRRLAAGLPLWMLVGIQGFRLPLELAMHTLADRGIMPEQMTYTGWNFDILTGISALLVAALIRRRPAPRLVLAWNIAGTALLANVVTIAIVSTPRLQWFGPDRLNTFVTYPPFVWLPAVMVLAALAGHLLVFRALAQGPTPGSVVAVQGKQRRAEAR